MKETYREQIKDSLIIDLEKFNRHCGWVALRVLAIQGLDLLEKIIDKSWSQTQGSLKIGRHKFFTYSSQSTQRKTALGLARFESLAPVRTVHSVGLASARVTIGQYGTADGAFEQLIDHRHEVLKNVCL